MKVRGRKGKGRRGPGVEHKGRGWIQQAEVEGREE